MEHLANFPLSKTLKQTKGFQGIPGIYKLLICRNNSSFIPTNKIYPDVRDIYHGLINGTEIMYTYISNLRACFLVHS